MIAAWTLRLLGAFCILGCVLPWMRSGHWFVRGWDFPRLQMAGISALVAAAFGLFAFEFGVWELSLWLAALGFAAMWQLFHVAPFTPLWPTELETARDQEDRMKLMTVNLNFKNDSFDEVRRQISEQAPDVLILIELNQAWRDGLDALAADFEYHHEEVRGNGLGMAVWSRWPLEDAETRCLVEERRPSIWTSVQWPVHPFRLVAVHPTPPGLDDETGERRRDSRVRDAELVLVAREVADDENQAWVIAGDFNDVAWSHTTRLFKRLSGLRDPRVGRNFMGTFHADYPLLRFPIDHVFLAADFAVDRLARHRIAGSDHFGVSVTLAPAVSQSGAEPSPKYDDEEEAKKIVDEGESDADERDIAAIG